MKIYCISGKLGSGKNYFIEKVLIPHLCINNHLVMALADHFKIDAICKDKLNYDEVYHNKTDNSRRYLQYRGTEQGRNVYGEDIWINTLYNWIKVYNERGIENFFITDVRFENEFKYFKNLGATMIRVESPDRNYDALVRESNNDLNKFLSIKNHSSETDLDSYLDKFDYIINNSYKDDINEEVKKIDR